MKIRHRLTLGLFAMAILVGGVGYIGFWQIGRIANRMHIVTNHETPAALKLGEMHTTILDGARQPLSHRLANAPGEHLAEHVGGFNEKMDQFDRLAEEFRTIAQLGNSEQNFEATLFVQILDSKRQLVSAASALF